MTLAKKGLRRIVVDGDPFVWKVSVDSGHLTVVVEAESGPTTRLEARTSGAWKGGTRMAIGPGGVAALIRAAQEAGWNPHLPGPPHRLEAVDPILAQGRTRLSRP